MERPSSSHFSFPLRRCALLGSTFFVVTALAAPSLASAPLPDDALVEAGIAKLQANAIDAALTLFSQAEKSAPRDPRPHFLRATALLKQKTPDAPGAIKSYRAALALDPKLARVHNELGAALLDAGQADEARKEWKAAVAADPTLGEAWYNLAKAERAHGDSDAASASFKTAMRLLPGDADVRIDYSLLLRKMGKITESLAAAREAVSLDTASGPAHVNLAFVLRAAGLLDDAQAELTVATRLAPEDAIAWWELGNVERERKKAAPARKGLVRGDPLFLRMRRAPEQARGE